MKTQILKFLLIALMAFTVTATISCEGPAGPQGEQGAQGEAGPQGEQGPVGNANVTRYIFDMHDFSENSFYDLEFADISLEEFEESVWLVYLVRQYSDGQDTFLVPGLGTSATSFYQVINSSFDTGTQVITIQLFNGPGEVYENAYVFQIPSSSTMDMTSKSLPNGLPSYLDVSDYNAVSAYLGENIKTFNINIYPFWMVE